MSRKRAKTDDEKEQRRIERVLRNRQAAQSSRERKRQEVEKLEGEKFDIEDQNQQLRDSIMMVQHEKFQLEQHVRKLQADIDMLKNGQSPPPGNSSTSTPIVKPHPYLKEEAVEDYPFNLPTPRTSVENLSPTLLSPPVTNHSFSRSPSPSGGDFDSLSSLDMTQHPAAMLCGLQCQSKAAWPRIPPSSTPLFLMILSSAIYSSLLPRLAHQYLSSIPTSSPPDSSIATSPKPASITNFPSNRWSTLSIRRPRRRTTLA